MTGTPFALTAPPSVLQLLAAGRSCGTVNGRPPGRLCGAGRAVAVR